MRNFKNLFFILLVSILISCQEKKIKPSTSVQTENMGYESYDHINQIVKDSIEINDIKDLSLIDTSGSKNKVDNSILNDTRKKSSPSNTSTTPSEDLDISKNSTTRHNNAKLEEKKPALAEPTIENPNNKPSMMPAPDHQIWNTLLKKHVSSTGVVNYKGFKLDRSLLENYLKSLVGPFEMKSWSTYEKMAYWINTYNAYTVKLVVDIYPLKSIKDLHNGKPWSQSLVYANDTYYTLDDVQKKILMPQFGDPRIHFAINCAAKSCPPLANQAYTKGNVNNLLESQTQSFINSSFNNIDAKKATLSNIFDWYASDFDDVISFINKYSVKKIDGKTKINYNDYDWSLNGQ